MMTKRWIIYLGIIIGVGLRVYLSIRYYGSYDQQSFEIVAQIVKQGGNVYAETNRYNYSPIWSLILALLSYIQIPLHVTVRLFLTLVDYAIALAIYKITCKPIYLLIFLLNPVSILLTGFHGQFDNFAALFLLLAFINRKRTGLMWLLGTISILIKQITIFGWLTLLFTTQPNKKRAIFLSGASALVYLFSFIPYLPKGKDGIINNVFLYPSSVHQYGLNGLITMPIFLVLMIVFVFLIRTSKLDPLRAILLSCLIFLVFAPGMAEQYFILPIIFASALPDWGYLIFTIITTIFLTGSPNNIQIQPISIWMTVWIAALVWLFLFIRPIHFFYVKWLLKS